MKWTLPELAYAALAAVALTFAGPSIPALAIDRVDCDDRDDRVRLDRGLA